MEFYCTHTSHEAGYLELIMRSKFEHTSSIIRRSYLNTTPTTEGAHSIRHITCEVRKKIKTGLRTLIYPQKQETAPKIINLFKKTYISEHRSCSTPYSTSKLKQSTAHLEWPIYRTEKLQWNWCDLRQLHLTLIVTVGITTNFHLSDSPNIRVTGATIGSHNGSTLDGRAFRV